MQVNTDRSMIDPLTQFLYASAFPFLGPHWFSLIALSKSPKIGLNLCTSSAILTRFAILYIFDIVDTVDLIDTVGIVDIVDIVDNVADQQNLRSY